MNKFLLKVKNLNKDFIANGKVITAVKNVNFEINEGETLALIGGSGCGKTTLAKMLLKLIPATSGEVIYKGIDILKMKESNFKPYRKKMQMIFQDPFASLNPRMTVKEIIEEPLRIHNIPFRNVATQLINLVQMPSNCLDKYPHEFSGGQRQRIGIARALALKPKFLVLDEPVSSLDVSIQAQIINLLKSLQEVLKLTYLLISHDLTIVKYISTNIAVMYLGEIVEITETKNLFAPIHHPYTQALLDSVMMLEFNAKKTLPQILNIDSLKPPGINGCAFASRCPKAKTVCNSISPENKDITLGHQIKCHF